MQAQTEDVKKHHVEFSCEIQLVGVYYDPTSQNLGLLPLSDFLGLMQLLEVPFNMRVLRKTSSKVVNQKGRPHGPLEHNRLSIPDTHEVKTILQQFDKLCIILDHRLIILFEVQEFHLPLILYKNGLFFVELLNETIPRDQSSSIISTIWAIFHQFSASPSRVKMASQAWSSFGHNIASNSFSILIIHSSASCGSGPPLNFAVLAS